MAGVTAMALSFGWSQEEVLPDSEGEVPVQIGPGGRIIRESPLDTDQEAGSPFHLHFLYESRYVSEGRDNLAGGSLLTTSTDLSWGSFSFAPWFAYGPDDDYSELNLSLIYSHQWGEDWEGYLGYTHLQFFSDNDHDNEIGVGVAYSGLEWFDLVGDAYYSFAGNGVYFEAGAVFPVFSTDEMSLGAFVLAGFNGGYVPDGHPGADNVSTGLDFEWVWGPKVAFTGFVGYSLAIDADQQNYEEDELLRDMFWGSLGFKVVF